MLWLPVVTSYTFKSKITFIFRCMKCFNKDFWYAHSLASTYVIISVFFSRLRLLGGFPSGISFCLASSIVNFPGTCVGLREIKLVFFLRRKVPTTTLRDFCAFLKIWTKVPDTTSRDFVIKKNWRKVPDTTSRDWCVKKDKFKVWIESSRYDFPGSHN